MVGEDIEKAVTQTVQTSLGGLVSGTGKDTPVSKLELVNVITSQSVPAESNPNLSRTRGGLSFPLLHTQQWPSLENADDLTRKAGT